MPDAIEPVAAQTSNAWPKTDRSLLEEGRPALPEFPLHCLPPWWRSWVSETAHGAGAPVDYIVQALLASVAGVCGAGVVGRITEFVGRAPDPVAGAGRGRRVPGASRPPGGGTARSCAAGRSSCCRATPPRPAAALRHPRRCHVLGSPLGVSTTRALRPRPPIGRRAADAPGAGRIAPAARPSEREDVRRDALVRRQRHETLQVIRSLDVRGSGGSTGRHRPAAAALGREPLADWRITSGNCGNCGNPRSSVILSEAKDLMAFRRAHLSQSP